MPPSAWFSVLGFGGPVYQALDDGFRWFLLLTVVLLFVQFLGLLRRMS